MRERERERVIHETALETWHLYWLEGDLERQPLSSQLVCHQ